MWNVASHRLDGDGEEGKGAVYRADVAAANGRSAGRPRAVAVQLKVDGYRAIAFKTGGKLHLRSRNNYDFTKRYPDVLRGLGKLPNETVIDGEIVAFDADGRPSFNSLQNFASAETSIVYYVTQVNRRCEGEAGRTDEMYGRLHLPARLVPRHEDVAQPPSLRESFCFRSGA